jgi:hypothetical protein
MRLFAKSPTKTSLKWCAALLLPLVLCGLILSATYCARRAVARKLILDFHRVCREYYAEYDGYSLHRAAK